jgi:hypothetical protein
MSKGLYAYLTHRLQIVLGELGKDESGSVEEVGEDGGVGEVDENHEKWEMIED